MKMGTAVVKTTTDDCSGDGWHCGRMHGVYMSLPHLTLQTLNQSWKELAGWIISYMPHNIFQKSRVTQHTWLAVELIWARYRYKAIPSRKKPFIQIPHIHCSLWITVYIFNIGCSDKASINVNDSVYTDVDGDIMEQVYAPFRDHAASNSITLSVLNVHK